MLFNSAIFILFAFAFFALWPLTKQQSNVRWAYLTIASFIFYGWWDWRFLFLLLGSGCLDFAAGLAMVRYPHYRHLLLGVSLFGNIGSLTLFKYSGFLIVNLARLVSPGAIESDLVLSRLPDIVRILPIGISFYTFQSMSYTIDIYRGNLQPTRNLLHFFAYLSMFPQLVAGPIVRASTLLPQLTHAHAPDEQERWRGFKLIVHGYFKKVVIADNLAPHVTAAFSATTLSSSSCFWWSIMTAFAFQIYCDFSGYSDIARGLAKWLGYKFPVNFNHPYISRSLREFWTRWHISLSTWFRDYVYIPLGGSRTNLLHAQKNMWITMLVSGFWHGAAWTFVLWGAVHALFLSIERLTRWPVWVKGRPGGRWIALLLVIVQVWIAWVFFRSTSLQQALHILKTMVLFHGEHYSGLDFTGQSVLAIAILRELYYFLQLDRVRLLPVSWQTLVEVVQEALLIVACVYLRGPGSEFIYFQF